MAMVVLAIRHFLPYSDWIGPLVGSSHLRSGIRHISVGDNPGLQE
jgi:hypothetical protein